MTKALADLIIDLQEDVPAVDGVPNDAQYERAIKEAVSEFSRRCGLKKNTTISIVSGTASYALPDDFLNLIVIDSPYSNEHNVIVSSTGIIPFSELSPFEEEITIVDKTLTIYPTPGYSMDRYMEYKAAWALDETDNYPLTDDEAEIVMLKAKAAAFEKLANASAGAGFKYSVGNMSVDKSGMADGYISRSSNFDKRFDAECKKYNGAAGFPC